MSVSMNPKELPVSVALRDSLTTPFFPVAVCGEPMRVIVKTDRGVVALEVTDPENRSAANSPPRS